MTHRRSLRSYRESLPNGPNSAIDVPWTVEQQQKYLVALSPREAVHVAVVASGEVVGFQALDLWAATLNSMAHGGQLGPSWHQNGEDVAWAKHFFEGLKISPVLPHIPK